MTRSAPKTKPNLLAIVGQTASGKSSLAMALAQKYDGEIIAADSRTLYKGLSIGTAKPSEQDAKIVRHHLIDIVGPDERVTTAQFKSLADSAIADIQARGKLPILVGGSGLYIDSVLYNYDFEGRDDLDSNRRAKLSNLDIAELQSLILSKKLELPENKHNKRYLMRVLEKEVSSSANDRERQIPDSTLMVGLKKPKAELEIRVRQRLKQMLTDGVLKEAEWALAHYKPDSEPLKSIIYRELRPYFEKQISLDEALENIVRGDLKLAKRQLSWFKRNEQISWFVEAKEAEDFVAKKLEV